MNYIYSPRERTSITDIGEDIRDLVGIATICGIILLLAALIAA